MTYDDRGTGKTTRLMEQAVRILGELPETHKVFVTGAHSRWMDELRMEFTHAGLVDVEFITIHQIKNGKLRGRRGVLLVDDLSDFPWRDQEVLYHERQYLESKDIDKDHYFKTGEMRNPWTHLSIL